MNVDTFYLRTTTTAAEGLPRRRFTVADVELMTNAGIIGYDERIELIGGEIVPMLPKGIDHESVKGALGMHWPLVLPPNLMFIIATTFRLTEDT